MRDLFGGSNSIAETLEEKKEEGKKELLVVCRCSTSREGAKRNT
jgi:hypothetical protein